MSPLKALCLILVISLFFLTGCWDRTELNDLAIELGWGLDQAENNKIEISAQFIIPSKIGMGQSGRSEAGKTVFIESGTGKDTLEAVQNMQTKLSREIFRGHRRVIVIGEQLARRGLDPFLDTYSRDPDIRLRADALIVKGSTAKQFLEASYPLENIPALGALKEHSQVGGMGDTSLLNFFIAIMSDGITPTLPVIELNQGSKKQDQTSVKGFQIVGMAVFNKDLKLKGFLNLQEDKIYLWLINRLTKQTITVTVPEGKGTASLYIIKMNSKIIPIIQGHTIKYDIILSGEGIIRENNTNLDLTQSKNLDLLEHVLEKEAEKEALQTIEKVQKQYGTDIFGFGEAIHQKYPSQWKVLKKSWANQFRKVEVSVHANLTIRRVGLTGPSLQLKNNEIKK
ncbi:Ger(x)C family spore germination protein [Bacillus salipaludis]|uniref:Ger(X)C family spore germination protein n=1 Tax=Bacillus salipaludis TaxID=2547811 RepID=A0A4R5VNJ9_9BACI|nr:Ger(x)C family spore germination protein [Bacillus salipaludis]MDQ6595818.1 Ger(x)C family spore germination protein [Bacillus salipaludis]TDK59847.1 Ger(x)C family spore germination protein [Bacillus salipaludis]